MFVAVSPLKLQCSLSNDAPHSFASSVQLRKSAKFDRDSGEGIGDGHRANPPFVSGFWCGEQKKKEERGKKEEEEKETACKSAIAVEEEGNMMELKRKSNTKGKEQGLL